jgi:hypothetical protein
MVGRAHKSAEIVDPVRVVCFDVYSLPLMQQHVVRSSRPLLSNTSV